MEITSSSSRPPERENPSPTNSPHSNGSSTTSSNGSYLHLPPTPTPTPTPPHTPSPKPRSHHDANPYPTTFVQADTTTFKQVVQMLTGSSDAKKSDPSAARGGGGGIPPIKSTGQKKQGFKLYERRNSIKNGLMINTFIPGLPHNPGLSPRKPEILSPSILDFPALVLSPITPMNEDTARAAADQEERAIAEKKFYFHPSPRAAAEPPQLLPLFPTTSPRVSGSSS